MLDASEILQYSICAGKEKVEKTLLSKLILGFIGGAMISLGYLAYIRVTASIVTELPSIANLVGGSVFPIGLIVILMAGGELITGNMMVVSSTFFAKKISASQLLKNWIIITLANVVGAVFVAYFFGHFVGLTHTGVFRAQVISMAQHKVDSTFLQSFVSGIGCNWFVGLAVWLCYGAKDSAGKILAIWFPVMIFVAIGFQHSIANCFIIPAAIFEGGSRWLDFIKNFIPVYLGNIVGGAVFVSGFYYLSYTKH
ncbi:formate/nitrite transporter family protein [Vagococcus elongatus]|uniref:Formate-nitrite transporter n=1 Tax=Vagococcus elongatus TaxID=180344 RepID=A0A430ALC8_9ENTE|nr:formate/nitrite transporter family protein [Vagococcus elongatus]RSU08932.1 formate-nitrite transporter [Vagococcus elongatus]